MLQKLLVAVLLFAGSAVAWSEPIKYTATFSAAGMLTKTDGTTEPFDGRIVFSMTGDTSQVHTVFSDGEFEGYETYAPLVIFIEGVGEMKSQIPMQSYSVRNSLELTGYSDEVLLPTFVLSYSGFYNLKTSYAVKGSWTVNYFNMGTIPTNLGQLQFTEVISDGGFAGKLGD